MAFPHRGVIEGFYGPPWSHSARLDALRWMGAHGMNVYVHAPKDDPYQRANWRDPYPDDRWDEITAEIRTAADAGVAWVPNVSPALPQNPGRPAPGTEPSRDVRFTGEGADLCAKLDRFVDAGCRVLMVSLDDVEKRSTHPEDEDAYGTGPAACGRMHRDLLNALAERYADLRLVTVLADYDGIADTPYLEAVRSDGGLADGIDVMWTGTAVVAPTIRTSDAHAYARLVGRDRVWIWDNYPVNDFAGGAFGRPNRLFLGPYAGRDPDLDTAVSGVVANPMSEALASRIALGTVAAYLTEPSSYEPETAWRAAIADLAGGDPELTDAIAALAENSRSSTLDRTESPVLARLIDDLLTARWPEARDALAAELDRQEGAGDLIAERASELHAEVGAFTGSLALGAKAARAALELLAALGEGPSMDRIVRLVGLQLAHHSFCERWEITHGDRLGHDLARTYVDDNRVDAFVRHAAREAGR